LRNPFSRNKQQTARSPSPPVPAGTAKAQQYPQSWMPYAYLPRKFEQRMGTTRNLDISLFKQYSLGEILGILRHAHPETSYAFWQFLRTANSGCQFKAKKMTGEDDKRGQKVLDGILWNLNHPPNSGKFEVARGMDLITGQLLLNTMIRGACGCEDVLNMAGKLDRIQVFDAGTVYFKSADNRLIPYQNQTSFGNGYVPLDYPTVFFQPLDPDTDDPYGSPPLASLIQIVVFQIQFMNDLLAAVHRVGYPRMTGTLVEEAFANQLDDSVKQDPDKYQLAADAYLNATKDALRNLNPDDYLVGWDTLKMDILGKGSNQAIRVDAVISVIEKSLSAALKTLLTILGRGENTSKESYASELKLYSRGIESVQKVVESISERALTLALNLEGVRGWVDVSFTPVDLRSELQVVAEKQTRQDIIITARMRGSISDHEEMKAHREVLGMIGEPEGWEELVNERKQRENEGGQREDYPRHGSPPATQ